MARDAGQIAQTAKDAENIQPYGEIAERAWKQGALFRRMVELGIFEKKPYNIIR